MSDGTTLAARARTEFVDLIEGLSADQLTMSTLCRDWNPHHVLAHLVTFVDVPLPRFMFNVARARGNFDAASDRMARGLAGRSVADLAASLRSQASQGSKMPGFPPELTLTDTVVHTQDVRRGLGLEGTPDAELLRTSLVFMTSAKRAKLLLEKDGLFDGLRLEATDIDWSFGDGALVSGPAESLLMAAMRRPAMDELSGDGVETLRGRVHPT